jgi:hypothetical protein
MNARQERGMQIAAMKQIRRLSPFAWLCPSQNSDKKYHVFMDHDNKHCSCPDHLELGVKCKHIFAVEIVIQRELFPDGTQTVTQTVVVAEKVKKSYAQDWPAYNAAQTHEKEKFLHCSTIYAAELRRQRRKPDGREHRLPIQSSRLASKSTALFPAVAS